MNNTNKQKQNKKSLGFAIVELAVVIVTIGILLSIIVVSYGNWQKSINIATLKSDLAGASSAMENARTFGGVYPSDITTVTTFKASNGVTLSGGSTDGGLTYCIAAVTSKDITLSYHIDSSTARQGAQTGNCGGMWRQISAGSDFTCAIANNNKVYCWGDNTYGQFGNNSTTSSLVPILVNLGGAMAGKTIKSISASGLYTCAIASDNLAYCWGYNYYGQLGNNSTVNSSVPVAVNTAGVLAGKTIKSISAGSVSACVIASDDLAYCWGSNSINSLGQLGNNSLTDSSVPVAVNTAGVLAGKTIKSITNGLDHACVIASDNLPYCWGGNWGGGLGNNTTTKSYVPVAVSTTGVLSGKTIKTIAAGWYYTCVIASDDLTYCWGDNTSGQLGVAGLSSSVPVAVSTAGVLSGKTVKSITVSGGQYHTCVIASDSLAYCWGWNAYGQLGNNSLVNSSIPVAVSTAGVLSGKTIKSITAATWHTCAIASNDLFYCWGNNTATGQLGNNSTVQSLVPVATVPIP